MTEAAIRLEDAGVRVRAPGSGDGTFEILRPTRLTLTERRVGVIGANGSGKSTLARLLNGLVVPTTGRVLVDGLDTAQDGPAVRARVAFTFTDPDAQLVMPTVAEDVALSLRRHGLTGQERADRVGSVLREFGLGDLADVSVHALSGGQKQLLALAGVLATDPEVLVCDEPTTLLDLRNTIAVADLLDRLPQRVVLVTHDLDLAARMDRVLIVEAGAVVYDGEPTAAVAAYRSLVAASAPVSGDAQPAVGGLREVAP